ncbi:taste receptor type 2 member 42 [Talpa occidentalis]|uniref:taste receptor type 2 member 42 n=1 Tax=Talpa occidentalis TaxID=50954 RepID=UPI0018900D27|nr:taste receptor type 2 member 42 [Talpa occidentalis]
MFMGLDEVFLILSIVEFLVGILGNVFIGTVNCYEWVKNHKISLADFILTCLALSRIMQLVVYLFQSFLMGPGAHIYLTYKLGRLFSLLWRVAIHLTTWLATCLSIFYLLKIAQFSHSFFLWLKWRMNRVVLMTLVSSLAILIFDLLLLERLFISDYILDGSNLTSHPTERKTSQVNTLIILSMTYFIPFLLSLTSLVLLFLSLVRHTRNLQRNSMASRDSSTEAHKRAMKILLSFLLLSVVHFISTQLAIWLFSVLWRDMFVRFLVLVMYVLPTGHSFILILGNKKLGQAVLKVYGILKAY